MPRFEGSSLQCRRGRRVVFDGLDFALEAGGLLLLTGRNGAGKSSLLRLMAGLLTPASGILSWDGQPVAEDAEAHRARLRHVGHLDALKPALTAAENLSFWANLWGGGDVHAALDAFGLKALADLPARFLSAGQKRRANLARLALAPAALWLLDEPATALDAETTERLRALIARHRDGGGMAVISTHGDLGLPGGVSLDLGDFQSKAAA